MPRMKQISRAQQLDDFLVELKSAPYIYLRTRFLIHERVETPAMIAYASLLAPPPPRPQTVVEDGDEDELDIEALEDELAAEEEDENPLDEGYAALAKAEGIEPCPCCGSLVSRLVETVEDLEVLIHPKSARRWNRWDPKNTKEDLARFDAMKAQAQPYGTPGAAVWAVDIDFTCSREDMKKVTNDRTRCLYFCGGWRSGKSHLASIFWLRGWVRWGGKGELFWLVGPELKTAYRLMVRIFAGRGQTDSQGWQRARSVAPKYYDKDLKAWRSCLAKALPAHEKVQRMEFEMIDGSVIELRHTKTVAALEGDTVRRVLFDEAIRASGPEGFDILMSRVAQGGGQLAIASIPGIDDRSRWLFEKVVQPARSGQARDKRVYTTPTYANLWLPTYEARAMEESYGDDEETITYGIKGEWSHAQGTAYGRVWQPKTMVRMGVLDADKPESWGFKFDVTRQVAASIWGGPRTENIEYLGGRDFNGPRNGGYHAAIICKIFGNDLGDPTSWAIVVLDEHIGRGNAIDAARQFRDFQGGKYAGKVGFICDRMGFSKDSGTGAKETGDAYEFEKRGCLVDPPERTAVKRNKRGGVVSGGEPWYPDHVLSQKLVYRLMEETPWGNRGQGRILMDGHKVKNLPVAIPQVKAGPKRTRDAGTRYDKTVSGWDDCLRYLAWRIFSDENPRPKPPKKVYRTNLPRLPRG